MYARWKPGVQVLARVTQTTWDAGRVGVNLMKSFAPVVVKKQILCKCSFYEREGAGDGARQDE